MTLEYYPITFATVFKKPQKQITLTLSLSDTYDQLSSLATELTIIENNYVEILLKASNDNNGKIYLASTNNFDPNTPDDTKAYELDKGESVSIITDKLSKWYVRASVAGEKISVIVTVIE